VEDNRSSNEYLVLNCAGVNWVDWNARILREKGRLDYQLIYLYEGQVTVEIDGVERIVPEGNMILYRPYEKQKYAFSAECPSLHCWFHFTGTGCEEILTQAGLRDIQILYIGKNKQLVDTIRKLEIESRLRKEGYVLLCRGYILAFFAQVMRICHYRNNPTVLKNTLLIEDVCIIIHKELDSPRPTAFYASYCNLSLSRFSHIFKEVTGFAPREYINHARLERAASLLTTTYLTIAEVAQKAGYHEQNHFTKAFKQKYGLTPNQYRTAAR